jgi:hypothetical protein
MKCDDYNTVVSDTCSYWAGLKLRKELHAHGANSLEKSHQAMHITIAQKMCHCVSTCQGSPHLPSRAKEQVDKIAITIKSAEAYLSGSERKQWLGTFLATPKVEKLLHMTRHLKRLTRKTTVECISESCATVGLANFHLGVSSCSTLSKRKPVLYPCLEYEKLLLQNVSGLPFISNLVRNLNAAKKWCHNFDSCATHDGLEKDFPFEMKFIDAITRKALGGESDIDFSVHPTPYPTALPSFVPTPAPTKTTASPTTAPTSCPSATPTNGPTKVNQTSIAIQCVTSRCVSNDLVLGVDLRVSCDRLYTSLIVVNNDGSPCQYYETLMWHRAYRPQTKDPIFHSPKTILKLCQAYAVCMGDFGAMQKALHSAAKYKAMLKVSIVYTYFAARHFSSAFTFMIHSQTKVKAVIGGTDYNNADSGFVKKALSDKSSAEELLGKTSVEVNIIEESSCMNPATAVKDIDDTVIIVGKITQFRSKPSNQQVLASFNDPASPFKHLNLEFKYGGHRVIQGLELGR